MWDEPALGSAVAPAGAPTYAAWLAAGQASASVARGWLLALGLAAVAGPWSVLGAFFGSFQTGSLLGLITVVVIAPIVEEICKVSATMIAIERRPFWFTQRAQILLAATAAGLVFALIENQIYFHVYIREPSAELIAWRKSVCVVLHTGCSLIAGLGLVRMWEASRATCSRPRAERAATALTVAALLHGAYNFAATLIDPVFN